MVVARVVKCVLLFQRRAAFLELIRGTHTGPGGLEYSCLSFYMLSFLVCSFVSIWKKKSVSFLCSFTMGCNSCHAKKFETISLLTGRPTDHGPIWQPTICLRNAVSIYCQTARACVSFHCGIGGLPMGTGVDTPSHTVLSLFCYLLINQNQVSL